MNEAWFINDILHMIVLVHNDAVVLKACDIILDNNTATEVLLLVKFKQEKLIRASVQF